MQEAPHIPAEPLNPPASTGIPATPGTPPAPPAPSISPAQSTPGSLDKLGALLHPPIRARQRKPRRHRPRSTPAQIQEILRQIHASDKHPAEACKEHSITLATYYRWRKLAQAAPAQAALQAGQISAPPAHIAHHNGSHSAGHGTAPFVHPAPAQNPAWPWAPFATDPQPGHTPGPQQTSASHGAAQAHPAHPATFTPAFAHPAQTNAEPPAAMEAEARAAMEAEARHLREAIVHLTLENVALKRHNAALLEALAQRHGHRHGHGHGQGHENTPSSWSDQAPPPPPAQGKHAQQPWGDHAETRAGAHAGALGGAGGYAGTRMES